MSFSPNLGRWIQEDPIEFEAGDPNLYRYENDNPTNVLDPMGLRGEQLKNLTLSYKDVFGPKKGKFGSFAWGINWALSNKEPCGGVIIQRVKITHDIQNWEGETIRPAFLPRGRVAEWLEVWVVEPNSKIAKEKAKIPKPEQFFGFKGPTEEANDWFFQKYGAAQPIIYGKFKIEGWARFYKANQGETPQQMEENLIRFGFSRNNRRTGAGHLLSIAGTNSNIATTTHDHTKEVYRQYQVEWDWSNEWNID